MLTGSDAPMSGGTVDRARIVLLAAGHAVDDSYQGAVPALLPFFVFARHYSYLEATGLTFALTSFSSVIQPLFGALADRRDLFWLVPAGLTVAGLGVGLSGLAPGYLLTFLAIVLAGIGVAAFHPEAARAARAASGDSQQAMSVFSAGGNVGFAAGPLFASAVVTAAGVRGTVLLALPAVAAGLVVYAVLARRRQAPAARGAAGQRAGDDDWRGFTLLTSVVVLRSVVFFALTSLTALYIGTGLHGGRTAGELALTTLLAAGAAGTITGGRLADRYGRVPVTAASLAGALAGMTALAVAPLPWVFLPVAVTGFALFQSFSLTVTLGQDYLPSRIGTSSGVTLGLAISVGGLLAPAFGAIADATSLHLALITLLAFPPAALALALRLRDPRPPARHGPPSRMPHTTAPSAR
jgi:FSR family fosmidomycin resistance protein-like MFS transporter